MLRLAQIIRANMNQITARALTAIKADPPLADLPLSDSERLDPVAASLRDLADHMESGRPNDDSELLLRSARRRGETRYQQGCPLIS